MRLDEDRNVLTIKEENRELDIIANPHCDTCKGLGVQKVLTYGWREMDKENADVLSAYFPGLIKKTIYNTIKEREQKLRKQWLIERENDGDKFNKRFDDYVLKYYMNHLNPEKCETTVYRVCECITDQIGFEMTQFDNFIL